MKEQYLYSAAQVRELDRIAIEDFKISGLMLMRRAADACVKEITASYPKIGEVTVFCGSGNNAGDGYIIAGMLAEKGHNVQVIVIGDPGKLGADAKASYHYCETSRARLESENFQIQGDLVVDALLGTGLTGAVRENYVDAIQLINSSNKPVLSVDIPSGLCADTGSVLGCAVTADITVTFIGKKRGLFTNDGPDYAGRVVFHSLEVPEDLYGSQKFKPVTMLAAPDFPTRRKNSYKTTHGHVLVIGGDHGLGGAVILSSEAALRTGAGLVSVATRPENVTALLARRPEIMVKGVDNKDQLQSLLEKATALVVGPGLGHCDWSRELLAAALDSQLPVVVDADGLNILATQEITREHWVLTPHPGEASTLLAGAGIQEDRFAATQALQQKYGGVVLLKGIGTLVSDGNELSLCPFGNPGMATAGMGDVLSGVIGALLAQGYSSYEAATYGATLHARAGDIAAENEGERGLIATDVISAIRRLVNA
ncbi:MAG: NAD(P)H-hydrate dehydratase [Gammaproteobacteria bacterium]|nr:NAD(P)H-hydrate dehydratase [Gammaproteobacteria bacterium]